MASTSGTTAGSKRMRAVQELQKNIDLLLNADDKDYLHYVLKEYSTYRDVDQLVLALCSCLDNSRKLNLLRDIRNMVPSAHLSRFDKLAPYHLMEDPFVAPSAALRSKSNVRTVSLMSKPGESLGFSIRGGKEHGLGVFVSQVDEDSDAYRNGLRTGDRLVEVNGVPFDRIAHSSAVRVLKSDGPLKISVQSTGRIPAKQKDGRWLNSDGHLLPEDVLKEARQGLARRGARHTTGNGSEMRQIRLARTEAGLGFSIRGGSEFGVGVYVSDVEVGSVASDNGLRVGDQIIDVNGTNFFNIQHCQAVETLRTAGSLFITVVDAGRVPSSKVGHGQTRWIRYDSSRRSKDGGQTSPGSFSVTSSLPDISNPRAADESIPGNSKLKRKLSLRDGGRASIPAVLKAGGRRLASSIVRTTASLRRSRSNSEGKTLDDIRQEHEAALQNYTARHVSPEYHRTVSEEKGGSSDDRTGRIVRSPSVFSRGMGSQVMWSPSQDSQARNMLEDAVGRLLVDEERAAFMLHFNRYEKEQNVENLVVSILPILNTVAKLDLLKELRPVLTARHIDKFDELVSGKEARVLREKVRPAVGPGAEAGQAVVHSELMAAIQGQGQKRLKKANTGASGDDKRKDGDGDGDGSQAGRGCEKMGVFAAASALTMLERASQTKVDSPQLRRRDSFIAWSNGIPVSDKHGQAVTRAGLDLPQVIVELRKTRPNLGLVIDGGVDTPQPEVLIKAVKKDSMAADDGFLKPGFEIVAVDGSLVKGRTHSEAVKIISLAVASNRSTIELVVIPTSDY